MFITDHGYCSFGLSTNIICLLIRVSRGLWSQVV